MRMILADENPGPDEPEDDRDQGELRPATPNT